MCKGHCDGCDTDDVLVALYDVAIYGNSEECWYCDDCAMIATANVLDGTDGFQAIAQGISYDA